MLIKVCLNGDRTRADHPAVPITADEVAREAAKAIDAGAGAVHVHAHGPDARESLDPAAIAASVDAVREARPGIPVGVSTGEWIEPDLHTRLGLIAGWDVLPDFASVNLSEIGALDVCFTLQGTGVGIEAGTASPDDARLLVNSGIAADCVRILVEPYEQHPEVAQRFIDEIDAILDAAGIATPRLYHGNDEATWPLLEAAVARGRDVRVGLEDTLLLPDGSRARDNAELVATVVAMVERARTA